MSHRAGRNKPGGVQGERVLHIGPADDAVAVAERAKASNEQAFDLVVFDEVLERSDNLREVLASARQIIAPAGLVLARVSADSPTVATSARTLDYRARATLEEDQSVFALDAEVLDEVFCSAGFRAEVDGPVVKGVPIAVGDFGREAGRKIEAAFSALRTATRKIAVQHVELATLRAQLNECSERVLTVDTLEAELARSQETVAMLRAVVRSGHEPAT